MALMVSSWPGGITWRMRSSTRAMYFSVSSMRVPLGARKCSFIRPTSTCGKKSMPTTQNRPTVTAQRQPAMPRTNTRCASATSSSRA